MLTKEKARKQTKKSFKNKELHFNQRSHIPMSFSRSFKLMKDTFLISTSIINVIIFPQQKYIYLESKFVINFN